MEHQRASDVREPRAGRDLPVIQRSQKNAAGALPMVQNRARWGQLDRLQTCVRASHQQDVLALRASLGRAPDWISGVAVLAKMAAAQVYVRRAACSRCR